MRTFISFFAFQYKPCDLWDLGFSPETFPRRKAGRGVPVLMDGNLPARKEIGSEKDPLRRMKRQATDWEEIFANLMPRQGPAPRTYNEPSERNEKNARIQSSGYRFCESWHPTLARAPRNRVTHGPCDQCGHPGNWSGRFSQHRTRKRHVTQQWRSWEFMRQKWKPGFVRKPFTARCSRQFHSS